MVRKMTVTQNKLPFKLKMLKFEKSKSQHPFFDYNIIHTHTGLLTVTSNP